MSKSKNSGGNKHTLTMRQLRFACEYAKSANGKGAARAAGYHGEDHSLEVQASRLLRNAEVLAKIEELRKPELEKAKVDLAHVVAELASVGFSDIGDIMDFDGATPRMKPVSALPERTRRAIASIKVRRVAGEEEIEVHEIKLWDKIAALRHAACIHAPVSLKYSHYAAGANHWNRRAGWVLSGGIVVGERLPRYRHGVTSWCGAAGSDCASQRPHSIADRRSIGSTLVD